MFLLDNYDTVLTEVFPLQIRNLAVAPTTEQSAVVN
jgi:hypothetical protein